MRSLLFIIFISFSVTLFSQHNHGGDNDEHEKAFLPSHGGEIVEAGKYKLEIVTNPMQQEEKLMLYILNKNYKEIKLKNATVNLTLKYKNEEKTDTITMHVFPDKFTATNIDLTRPINIFFTIQTGTKTITATYYYEGLIKH